MSEARADPAAAAAPPAPPPAPPLQSLPPPRARAELSVRSVTLGCLCGALLAVTNTYMGLKTGFWESGCVLSSLLAFGGLSVVARGRAPSPLETNLAQTAAVSVAAMPASAGLLGAIPALTWLSGSAPSGGAVALWGLGLGTLGVLFAFLLRRRLLEQEALPFPTGAATAELISTLHAQGGAYASRAWALAASALGSGGLTWLRDAKGWVPTASLLPATLRVGGVGANTLLLGVGWSPMMLGIGVLAGPQAGLGMLLGSLVAWGGLAPWLVRTGTVTHADFDSLAAWLLWPGVGLMVGASFSSLVSSGRALGGALRDLRRLGAGGEAWEARVSRWILWALPPVLLLTLITGWLVFRLEPWHFPLVLLLAFPLCAVCARTAGQMDIAPISSVGQVAQVAFGTVFPQRAVLDIAAGALVSGAASHTSSSLWSLQAGRLLGASASRQLLVQLAGLLLGAAVAVPVYSLLVSVHGLGSASLPTPAARQFQAVAQLASQGLEGLPPSAGMATGVACAVGVVCSVLSRGRWERWLPSAAAMGVGFILPVHYAVTLSLGSVLALVVGRLRPSATQGLQAAGAGAIISESLLGVFIPLLAWSGLLTTPG